MYVQHCLFRYIQYVTSFVLRARLVQANFYACFWSGYLELLPLLYCGCGGYAVDVAGTQATPTRHHSGLYTKQSKKVKIDHPKRLLRVTQKYFFLGGGERGAYISWYFIYCTVYSTYTLHSVTVFHCERRAMPDLNPGPLPHYSLDGALLTSHYSYSSNKIILTKTFH